MLIFIENIQKTFQMYGILWLKAGIEKDKLLIALEPETASLCCKKLSFDKMVGAVGGYDVFSPGSTNIVLDAGGKLILVFFLNNCTH